MPVRPLVLVAVDESHDAESIVRYAAAVATSMAADLHAVQVVSRGGGLWRAPDGEVGLRARLTAMRPGVERGGVAFRVVTLRGTPAAAVAAYAQFKPVRLIVVGPRYRTSRVWRRTAITRRLARTSPVPVLVVPRPADTDGRVSWNRIVAAIDSGPASRVALRTALDVGRAHGASVTMFHAIAAPREVVYTGSEALRVMAWLASESRAVVDRLKGMARTLGAPEADAVVLSGDPHRGLLRTAEEKTADLIVMAVSPRTWFEEAVSGSTLRGMLRRVRVPLLVVPVTAADHAGGEGGSALATPTRLARVLPMRKRAA